MFVHFLQNILEIINKIDSIYHATVNRVCFWLLEEKKVLEPFDFFKREINFTSKLALGAKKLTFSFVVFPKPSLELVVICGHHGGMDTTGAMLIYVCWRPSEQSP